MMNADLERAALALRRERMKRAGKRHALDGSSPAYPSELQDARAVIASLMEVSEKPVASVRNLPSFLVHYDSRQAEQDARTRQIFCAMLSTILNEEDSDG